MNANTYISLGFIAVALAGVIWNNTDAVIIGLLAAFITKM